jgi:hypothetical protein
MYPPKVAILSYDSIGHKFLCAEQLEEIETARTPAHPDDEQ